MGCCRRMSEAEKAALPECRGNLARDVPGKRGGCCRGAEAVRRGVKSVLLLLAIIAGCVLGYFIRDVGPFKNPSAVHTIHYQYISSNAVY